MLSCGVPSAWNISSKGGPGGNWKWRGFPVVVTVVEVDILTTDGINFSARSANDSGTGLEVDCKVKLKENIIVKNINFIFFIFNF